MEPRIAARYPRGNSWGVLIVLSAALYVCLDIKFFHRLDIAPNPDTDSFEFTTFCGVLVILTFIVTKEVFHPTNILSANSFGLELNYCFYKPRIQIPWNKVTAIKSGKHTFTFPTSGRRGGGGSIQERMAVEIFFDNSIDLGLLGEALAHPESRHAILIGDYLFIHGFNDAIEKFKLFHPVAFVPNL